MDPQAELDQLGAFAKHTFGVHPPLGERTRPADHPSGNVSQTHWIHQATRGSSTRLCVEVMCFGGEHLFKSIPYFFESEVLPPGLLDADLCLIPKPGKPADVPKNLRPLGILRPDAKGLAGAARKMLSSNIQAYVQDVPQFAYLPGRGLADAYAKTGAPSKGSSHPLWHCLTQPSRAAGGCVALTW